MKKARFLAAMMTVLFAGSIFLGCSKENSKEEAKDPSVKQEEPAKEKVEQKIVYNLGADPKTIDPQLNSAVDGSIVLNNAFEGLMREDGNSKVIPGVAEKYEVSDDQLTYTFHLRKDAKWSDGKPVVAGDF